MLVLILSSSVLHINISICSNFDVFIAAHMADWQVHFRKLFGRSSATSNRTAISGHVAKPRPGTAISVLFSMGVGPD